MCSADMWLPILCRKMEMRGLALHHRGPGGTGRGAYLSVVMLRCNAIAAGQLGGGCKFRGGAQGFDVGVLTVEGQPSLRSRTRGCSCLAVSAERRSS